MDYTGKGRATDYEVREYVCMYVYMDTQAAQIWTQKAAQRGDPNAMLTYGAMFLESKAMTR